LFNADFDGSLTEYSERYVETQAFSAHHRQFAAALAQDWIDRYNLSGKFVFEIGPGHGADFLRMFCDLSGGDAIGIGPSSSRQPVSPRVSLISDYFDARWTALPGAAVICRHTLEHIPDVRGFLSNLRLWADRHPDAVFLFEVPDAQRILDAVAFWDLSHEHCNYFTPDTLEATFTEAGFTVLRCERVYDDQYIVLEACGDAPEPIDEDARARQVDDLRRRVAHFVSDVDSAIEYGSRNLAELAADGTVLFWQASAKAVSLLDRLGETGVAAIVDIDPGKRGRYLPGGNVAIVSEADIAGYAPRHVVVMNPAYLAEISAALRRVGIEATVSTVDELTARRGG
jgi:hypothetical protein